MSAPSNKERPSRRELRQKRLRYTSWATVIMGIIGFPPALSLYVWATVSCWGSASASRWCDVFSSLPWVGLVFFLAAYLFVLWIIHGLGQEQANGNEQRRVAWRQAKQGYKGLDKGHHRLVRRVHRMFVFAFSGLAAYVSFQFFEADTPVNLLVALCAYIAGEILNWKKFTKINY